MKIYVKAARATFEQGDANYIQHQYGTILDAVKDNIITRLHQRAFEYPYYEDRRLLDDIEVKDLKFNSSKSTCTMEDVLNLPENESIPNNTRIEYDGVLEYHGSGVRISVTYLKNSRYPKNLIMSKILFTDPRFRGMDLTTGLYELIDIADGAELPDSYARVNKHVVDPDIYDYLTRLKSRFCCADFIDSVSDQLKSPLKLASRDWRSGSQITEKDFRSIKENTVELGSSFYYYRDDGCYQVKRFEQSISIVDGCLDLAIVSEWDRDQGGVYLWIAVPGKLKSDDKDKLLSTSIDSILSRVRRAAVSAINKKFSIYHESKKSSKLKRSEMDFDEWYRGNMYEDDSLEFIQLVESKLEKKYPGCEVFEEPSTQGTRGIDFWSVTLEDGRHYSVEFDFNEELGDMFELGPKRAATQYANEIISQIKSGEALVEDY